MSRVEPALQNESLFDDADATRDRFVDLLTKQDVEPLWGMTAKFG
jgi:hypothetical protein